MKGYKIFNPDFTCKGMQYKENEIFEVPLPISICNKGIHFCTKASHCFSYYSFDPKNIVCEVEALGEIQTHSEDSHEVLRKKRPIPNTKQRMAISKPKPLKRHGQICGVILTTEERSCSLTFQTSMLINSLK